MDSSRSPLARLLDVPNLARLVPQLAPETLHQLIQGSGLHASGELVALATPAQVTAVLDADLWGNSQPGLDDQFDANRFGEWLEVLVDTSEAVAARVVAALDESLVVAGLSRYVQVFDPSAIAVPASVADEMPDLEPSPAAAFDRALGGYLVRAIRPDAWDAIVSLLIALEADYPTRFHAVMRGCRRLSNSAPEVDGLDSLLTEPEQLLHGVAVDRELRRSQLGYSTPADARAFLEMARQPTRWRSKTNPIATAYFRAADESEVPSSSGGSPLPPIASAPDSSGSVPDAFDAAVVLAEIGLLPSHPRALLDGRRSESSRFTSIQPLMEHVRDNDAVYLKRSRELAFLANTLIAGCSIQSRPFTSHEASEASVGICNLGLEHWPDRWLHPESRMSASAGDTNKIPATFLVDHDLVSAFEVGWTILHQDVCMFVAEQLIVTLRDLQSGDKEIQRGLGALRRELLKQRRAGTPWRARGALDTIAMLDVPAWTSLLGLLDECPVVPAALTAIVEGHTGAISATAFEFISTTGQIDQVRAFMAKLPAVLSA